MKSIAFFNNKGGVGKTTLACNMAYALANRHRKRVLVVDCDPQCNATQLVIPEDIWLSIYSKSGDMPYETLLDVLRPIQMGDASISLSPKPIKQDLNRFGVDIIPGHPSLSVLEEELGKAWVDVQAARIGGFRRTSWLNSLLKHHESNYDVAIVDVGPSLGALNRSVLLATDYFLTPMGPEIFSIIGIRNIAEWLSDWIRSYEYAIDHYNLGKGGLDQFDVVVDPGAKDGYIGYTILQYITKSKMGERRPTKAFEEIIKRVPAEIHTRLGKFVSTSVDPERLHLGDVPNMYSIIALAHTAHAPIAELEHSDGIKGAQSQQREKYSRFLDTVSDALLENMKV